jgi:peptidoglycan hydrolase-like protein with peptidoglycan-binding domain
LWNNRKAVASAVQKLPFVPNPQPETTDEIPSSASGLDVTRLLTTGSEGPEVIELQKLLNGLGYTPPLVVDGKFGIKTANALKLYNNGSPSITLADAYKKLLNQVTAGLF